MACTAVVIGAALLQGAFPRRGRAGNGPHRQRSSRPLHHSRRGGGSRSAGAGCGTGRPSGSWRAVSATCPPFSASSNPPRISSTSTSSDGAFCSASTPWALPSSSPRRCGNDFRAAIATTADGSRSMTASALTSSTGLCSVLSSIHIGRLLPSGLDSIADMLFLLLEVHPRGLVTQLLSQGPHELRGVKIFSLMSRTSAGAPSSSNTVSSEMTTTSSPRQNRSHNCRDDSSNSSSRQPPITGGSCVDAPFHAPIGSTRERKYERSRITTKLT